MRDINNFYLVTNEVTKTNHMIGIHKMELFQDNVLEKQSFFQSCRIRLCLLYLLHNPIFKTFIINLKKKAMKSVITNRSHGR